MKIRIITVIIALLLACLGAYLIVAYVQGADQRALGAATPTSVLVVARPVAAGTPVEQLAPYLETRQLPLSVVSAEAMTGLTDASGTVTAVDLVPGEILLSSRLVDPASLESPGTVPVPTGMQEVTVQLTADRVVGGRISAGDTVGVFLSFDSPPTTHLQLQKVLVTSVQGSAAATTSSDPKASSEAEPPTPAGTVLTTLALSAKDAEKVVFAAEFGSIWLSLEPAEADEGGTSIVTPGSVYQ